MNYEKNEQGNQTLYVGFAPVKVLTISPERSELNKIFGKEDSAEDIELVYTKEEDKVMYKEGEEDKEEIVNSSTITVWVKEENTDKITPLFFTIKNYPLWNKDRTTKCYVNQFGKTFYCDDEANLPDWFTKKSWKDRISGEQQEFSVQYRECLVGEREFFHFLNSWLNPNEFSETSNLLYDVKQILKGNFKELREVLSEVEDVTVVVAFTVKAKDDGTFAQRTAKHFLKGQYYQKLNVLLNSNTDISQLEVKGKANKGNYEIKEFYSNLMGEYQKDIFDMVPIRQYVPGETIATDKPTVSAEDSSY